MAECGSAINVFTIFIFSCLIGYYVILKVSPALHASLMSITNAISGIVIVGAVMVYEFEEKFDLKLYLVLFSVFLSSINIFGGWAITNRMVRMFKKSKK